MGQEHRQWTRTSVDVTCGGSLEGAVERVGGIPVFASVAAIILFPKANRNGKLNFLRLD